MEIYSVQARKRDAQGPLNPSSHNHTPLVLWAPTSPEVPTTGIPHFTTDRIRHQLQPADRTPNTPKGQKHPLFWPIRESGVTWISLSLGSLLIPPFLLLSFPYLSQRYGPKSLIPYRSVLFLQLLFRRCIGLWRILPRRS